MFSGCSSLKYINLSNFNTQSVTNMSYTFSGCSSLKNINLSSFNTQSVTDMSFMFYNCSSLTNLDLSNFTAENLITMCGMFKNCRSLRNLDLYNFKININAYKLKNTNLSQNYNYNTINSIFDGCDFLRNANIICSEEIILNENSNKVKFGQELICNNQQNYN